MKIFIIRANESHQQQLEAEQYEAPRVSRSNGSYADGSASKIFSPQADLQKME